MRAVDIDPLQATNVRYLVINRFRFIDKAADVEVVAANDFTLLDYVGVDYSKDNIIDYCWKMHWYHYPLSPIGVAISRYHFCLFVYLPKLHPDKRIAGRTISRLEALALVNLDCQLITFSLDMWWHEYLPLFVPFFDRLDIKRGSCITVMDDTDTDLHISCNFSKVVGRIGEGKPFVLNCMVILRVNSLDVDDV